MAVPERRDGGQAGPALPEELSILPLTTGVLFPGMTLPIAVEEEPVARMVEQATLTHRILGVVAVREGAGNPPGPADLFEVGTAARILQMVRVPQGGYT